MRFPPRSRVFVVDDDPSIRDAVRGLLASAGLRCEVFAATHEFLGAERLDAPACLVLDVRLAGMNGLDFAEQLRARGDQIPIVFISGVGTIPMSVRAIRGGAVEFLPKPVSDDALLSAVAQALARDDAARRRLAHDQALRIRFGKLTARERDVLSLVVAGRLNKQIAAQLGTAEQTVKQQRGRVMRKLEVQSVADLVRLVVRYEAANPTKVS
jgi:FixJ family two-component response regulator